MATPPRLLDLRDEKQIETSAFVLAILVYNVLRGRERVDVGYEDADVPYEEFIQYIHSIKIKLPKSVIESMLWSSNLLDEVGDFWHPNKTPFETFVKRGFHLKQIQLDFDRAFNLLRQREFSKKKVGEE